MITNTMGANTDDKLRGMCMHATNHHDVWLVYTYSGNSGNDDMWGMLQGATQYGSGRHMNVVREGT